MTTPGKFSITELPIRLGQFLKLANLAQDGLEARVLVQEGQVLVNGIVEKRRGRKLFAGDTVTTEGVCWMIEAGEDQQK